MSQLPSSETTEIKVYRKWTQWSIGKSARSNKYSPAHKNNTNMWKIKQIVCKTFKWRRSESVREHSSRSFLSRRLPIIISMYKLCGNGCGVGPNEGMNIVCQWEHQLYNDDVLWRHQPDKQCLPLLPQPPLNVHAWALNGLGGLYNAHNKIQGRH